MTKFILITWRVVSDPLVFFESIRDQGFGPPYRYFLAVALVLSILSPLAWACGVDGGSPINTSTTAQRDVYHWWYDTLHPQLGNLSFPVAMFALLVDMHIVLALFTPIMHLVFRAMGGQGPFSSAWKAVCYGIAPSIVLGFLPFIGLLVGVYATLLQLYVAPACLYRLKDGRAYLLLVVILSVAIAAFWHGVAL